MSKFSKVTHILAVAYTAVLGFAASDAGQAIIRQYPKLSAVGALIGLLGSLYHTPSTKPSTPTS